jgi:cell division protein FtsQ
MKEKRNSRGKRDTPRVYDKASGEYRPVPRHSDRGVYERSARYATPQRRAENRRRRKHRALLFFYLFTFVTVLTAAVALSLTVLFKIDSIEVQGTSRYSAEEIIRISGIRKGDNLFLTKTREAGQKIQSSLPYIGTAKVSRRLPAKIRITVSEEAASGAVEYNKKYAIVSASGKVLEFADSIPQGCPAIKGLKLSGAQVGKNIVYQDTSQEAVFRDLTAAIASSKLEKVTTIDLSNSYKIQIIYDGRITMNLGLSSDFDYKLRFAKSILDAGKIKETEHGTLNLSVVAEENNAYFDPDYTVSTASSNRK